MRRVIPLLVAASALLAPATATAQVVQQATGTDAEYRALHAPAAGVVWAGGHADS